MNTGHTKIENWQKEKKSPRRIAIEPGAETNEQRIYKNLADGLAYPADEDRMSKSERIE
jgi:hypothetical protein